MLRLKNWWFEFTILSFSLSISQVTMKILLFGLHYQPWRDAFHLKCFTSKHCNMLFTLNIKEWENGVLKYLQYGKTRLLQP